MLLQSLGDVSVKIGSVHHESMSHLSQHASAQLSMNDTLQGKDAERIREFLLEHRPHVVAVGAAGLEARQLKVYLPAGICTLSDLVYPPSSSGPQGLLGSHLLI